MSAVVYTSKIRLERCTGPLLQAVALSSSIELMS
jgi:hypothetical protein